jgi:hypothetical protein
MGPVQEELVSVNIRGTGNILKDMICVTKM